ncbi:MAG: type II secretion system major pseudopilin GspG [Gammaproteobacteria bacterium]
MKSEKFGIRRSLPGFTLLELLVVLAILGLLAGLVGPRIMKLFAGAQSDTVALQIKNLSTTLDAYRLDVGRYPSTSEGLQALIESPSNGARWNGPYLDKKAIPKDPWGNELQYRYPGEHGEFDLYSLGADNTDGGEGENKDIASWD